MIGVDGAVYLIRRGLSDRASGIFLFRLFSLAFAGRYFASQSRGLRDRLPRRSFIS